MVSLKFDINSISFDTVLNYTPKGASSLFLVLVYVCVKSLKCK